MDKTFSLRKKRTARPKISAPKQISAPLSSPLPPGAAAASTIPGPAPESLKLQQINSSSSSLPRKSMQANGNTADYVKRRYSTRVTQLPKDFDAPPVPTLPSVTPQSLSPPPAKSERRPSGDIVTSDKVSVDVRALQDPKLQPDQYVAKLLSNASEQEIRNYQQDLGKIKNRTSVDLQHNVYQNRNQFIKISQEADKLKGEMRALRNLMTDLTSTLGQTNAALGISTDTISARKYANRTSVANLEAMWSTQLQELWKHVEGSQKYLPAIPGRHILHESRKWVELNTATWKPRRRVHLILLNDHLLVATEKKRQDAMASPQTPENQQSKPGSSQMQLSAERCWPLQDVEIADLASKSIQAASSRRTSRQFTANAISIRAGSDSFTYATTEAEAAEKTALLAKFRKAATDLQKLLHGDTEERAVNARPQGRPLSTRGTDGMALSKLTGTTSDPNPANRANMLVDVDGRQQEFHWVENQVDELDIDIALQRFEEGVGRVDKLRRVAKTNKSNNLVQDLNDGKVQERANKLAKAIIRQLVETSSFLTATQQNVTWLTKLGFEMRASEAYLDARGKVIKTRTSQCTDQGDLHHYLYQISYIYFRLIRNTVSIYQTCFSQAMASACIKWAKDNVEDFNNILARRMNRLERGGQEWNDCLERVREQAGILSEVGIDFRSIVGRNL